MPCKTDGAKDAEDRAKELVKTLSQKPGTVRHGPVTSTPKQVGSCTEVKMKVHDTCAVQTTWSNGTLRHGPLDRSGKASGCGCRSPYYVSTATVCSSDESRRLGESMSEVGQFDITKFAEDWFDQCKMPLKRSKPVIDGHWRTLGVGVADALKNIFIKKSPPKGALKLTKQDGTCKFWVQIQAMLQECGKTKKVKFIKFNDMKQQVQCGCTKRLTAVFGGAVTDIGSLSQQKRCVKDFVEFNKGFRAAVNCHTATSPTSELCDPGEFSGLEDIDIEKITQWSKIRWKDPLEDIKCACHKCPERMDKERLVKANERKKKTAARKERAHKKEERVKKAAENQVKTEKTTKEAQQKEEAAEKEQAEAEAEQKAAKSAAAQRAAKEARKKADAMENASKQLVEKEKAQEEKSQKVEAEMSSKAEKSKRQQEERQEKSREKAQKTQVKAEKGTKAAAASEKRAKKEAAEAEQNQKAAETRAKNALAKNYREAEQEEKQSIIQLEKAKEKEKERTAQEEQDRKKEAELTEKGKIKQAQVRKQQQKKIERAAKAKRAVELKSKTAEAAQKEQERQMNESKAKQKAAEKDAKAAHSKAKKKAAKQAEKKAEKKAKHEKEKVTKYAAKQALADKERTKDAEKEQTARDKTFVHGDPLLLIDGATYAFKGANGYCTVSADKIVECSRLSYISGPAEFVVNDLGGRKFRLKSASGDRYCALDENKRIKCDRDNTDESETFLITATGETYTELRIGMQTEDKKFCADEGIALLCNRPPLQNWRHVKHWTLWPVCVKDCKSPATSGGGM